MKKSEPIEVILNAVLAIESKMDALIEHSVSPDELEHFNENLAKHLEINKQKYAEFLHSRSQLTNDNSRKNRFWD